MTAEELRKQVRDGVAAGQPVPELRKLLVDFACDGGRCETAQAILEELRTASEEEPAEDVLLELLDFATGFCQPELRIWSDAVHAER